MSQRELEKLLELISVRQLMPGTLKLPNANRVVRTG